VGIEIDFVGGFMAANIGPLQDRVIVKRLEEEEKTRGGPSSRIRPRKHDDGKAKSSRAA
jgi:co-chaperonin GroES (HSP10)